MRFIVLFIFIIISFEVNAQSIRDTSELRKVFDKANILQQAFNPKDALHTLKAIESESETAFGKNSLGIAKLYYQIASCQLDLALYSNAKSYLDKALNIHELIDSISIPLADTYMLIGIYYDYMADYDRALHYYQKTKYIYQKRLPPKDQRFGYLFNNIGICIFFKGDIQRALGFFNKTVSITVESAGIKSTKVSRDLTNASLCQTKLNNTDEALSNLSRSLELAEHNQVLDSYVGARIFHALSIAQFEKANYELALEYGNRAHQLRIKHFHPLHIEVAKGYFSQADIYLALNKPSKAKALLQKSLEIYQKLFEEHHPEIAYLFFKQSSIAAKENDLATALDKINNSLNLFNYDEHIPINKHQDFDQQVLDAIELKAQIHFELWKIDKNLLQLKKSNKIYSDLLTLFNEFRKGFKEQDSKELIASNYFHIFEAALEVSYELAQHTNDHHFNEQAFQRAEYSTSYVLLEHLRNTKAKQTAQIPDSLLKQEQQLREDIASVKQDLNYNQAKPENDEASTVKLSAKLFDLKEQHNDLIEILENNYHNYHYYKQDLSTVSLQELQATILEHDQSLVEYFIGEKNIFVFVISKENFTLEKIKKDFPLEEWTEGLRLSINQYQFPFNLSANYHRKLVDYSSALYKKLVLPIEKHLHSRLIIIPTGILAEIPFECFIKTSAKSAASYKEHHYLIKDYAISYCYSASLLKEMLNHRSLNTSHKALAFAPDFNNSGNSGSLRAPGFLPLNYNDDEVKALEGLINAKAVIGDQATESYFISESDKYSILHFATHAQANNENSEFSFLAFTEVDDTIENELLFVKDIYNLNLKADMVTLSACETGIGELRKGEGIISLARSFAYSGAGNINTSLWKVNDQSIAELMQNYYRNIAKSMTKDIALQQAKIELISARKSHTNSHPYFWTSMITIGDSQQLKLDQKYPMWMKLLLLLMLCTSIYWFVKKRNRTPLRVDEP